MYSSPRDPRAIERAVWDATNVPWYPRRASMAAMADTKWAGLALRLLFRKARIANRMGKMVTGGQAKVYDSFCGEAVCLRR